MRRRPTRRPYRAGDPTRRAACLHGTAPLSGGVSQTFGGRTNVPGWRDMWWAFDCLEAGVFKPYLDQYVAVSGQRLLGASADPVALREESAQKYDLAPFQPAIISGPQSKYYGVELGRVREL